QTIVRWPEAPHGALSDPYLFHLSFLFILISSSSGFPPILQDDEGIPVKNEKISGRTLLLAGNSGILSLGDNTPVILCAVPVCVEKTNERPHEPWRGYRMRSFAPGASTTRLRRKPPLTSNACAPLCQHVESTVMPPI